MSKSRVIASLIGRLGFRIEDGKLKTFKRQLTGTERRMRAARKEVYRARAAFRKFSITAGTLLKGYLAAKVGQTLITDFTDLGDEIDKNHKRMGVTIKDYQGLAHAAALNGTAIEPMRKGMVRLARNLNQASDGLKTSQRSFKKLGIEFETQDGQLRSQRDVLFDIADAIANMENETLQTAMAQEVFGQSGAKLLPMLRQGRKGMQQMMQETEKYGGLLDEASVAMSRDFKDAIQRLKLTLTGLRNEFAKRLIPGITRLVKRFTDWYKAGNNAERMMRWLRRAAKAAGMIIGIIVTKKVIGLFNALRTGIYHLARSFIMLGKAGMIAKIKSAALFGLLIGLALVIKDLVAFAQGGESVIGDMLDPSTAHQLKKSLLEIWDAMQLVGAALADVFEDIQPYLPVIIDAFGKVAVFLAEILAMLIIVSTYAIKQFVRGVQRLVYDVKSLGKWFSDVWGKIKGIGSEIKSLASAAYKAFSNVAAAIMEPVDKVIQLYNDVKNSLSGGKRATGESGFIGGGLNEMASSASSATNNLATTTTTVGSVAVNIDGSTGMGPDQTSKAVARGVNDGLQNTLNKSYSQIRPLASEG